MNNFFRYLFLACVALSLIACSAEKPRVRARSQRATEITDFALKRSGGNTYNLNDVGPGVTTGYVEIDPSTYEVDASVEGISQTATTHFTAEEDKTYTVVVDTNRTTPTVRVFEP